MLLSCKGSLVHGYTCAGDTMRAAAAAVQQAERAEQRLEASEQQLQAERVAHGALQAEAAAEKAHAAGLRVRGRVVTPCMTHMLSCRFSSPLQVQAQYHSHPWVTMHCIQRPYTV